MQRLANGTQTAAPPSPATEAGTPGYATDGDPAGSTPASLWDCDQYNRMQEEIVAPIVAAGIALNAADSTQLLQAMRVLVGFRRRAIYAVAGSYSFVAPADALWARITVVGSGGGSGASLSSTDGGAGGGAGGYSQGVFRLTPGATYTVTIPAGGIAGGTSGGPPGGNGGTTSFGSLIAATGGTGGGGGSTANGGGLGGLGVSGDINLRGGPGGDGLAAPGSAFPGNGGASAFGGGGKASTTGFSAIQGGQAPGSGAGGAYLVTAGGGTGAAGLCMVEY